MPILAWDGRFLVADSLAPGFFHDQRTNKLIGVIVEDAIKIFIPTHVRYQNTKVLAVGALGDCQLMDFISRYDLPQPHDLVSNMFIEDCEANITVSAAMLITKKDLILLTIRNGKLQIEIMRNHRTIIGGSGIRYIGPRFSHLSSFLIASIAMKEDAATGGTLTVWDKETDKLVHSIRPYKSFLKLRTAIQHGIYYLWRLIMLTTRLLF